MKECDVWMDAKEREGREETIEFLLLLLLLLLMM